MSNSGSLSYRVHWENAEQTILYCALTGAWEWSTVNDAFRVIRQMADSLNHSYSLLLDLDELTSFTGSQFLSNTRKLIDTVHPRFSGHLAITHAPELLQELEGAARMTYAAQFSRLRVYFMETVDEARAILRQKAAY